MTPERVWEARDRMTSRYSRPRRRSTSARRRGRRRAHAPLPAAPTSSSAPARARSRYPRRLVAIHRVEALRGIEADGDGLRLGALVTHEEIAAHPASARVSRRSPTRRRSSARTRPAPSGTLGGNLMNASPAMETGGPLVCFDATVDAALGGGARTVAGRRLFAGPGRRPSPRGRAARAVDVPRPPPGTGSAYVRLEYRRQMEIAVVGATAVVALDDGTVCDARDRDHGARADDPPRAGGGGRARRARRRRRGRRRRGRGGGRGRDADLRRPRARRLPAGDGGGDRAPCDRGCVRAPRRHVPIPASGSAA